MGKSKSLQGYIKNIEYSLAKYKFVLSNFPDANIYVTDKYLGFSSKLVNQIYTKYEFVKGFNSIYVVPYYELLFDYNGNAETIRINSLPRTSRLAYMADHNGKKILKFSKLAANLKNNNFSNNMLNECRVQIMQFVKDTPNCVLDTTHLENRLKKLLLFT